MKCFILRVFLIAIGLLPCAAFCADLTDLWYASPAESESGWGVNVVQSNFGPDAFLFITFFIYGADNMPTWYSADLTWDGTRYAGKLWATQGTFWVDPWNPADHPQARQVGTASFEPLDAYHATLTYAVSDTGSVSKPVVRESLTTITIAGSYLGAQSGSYSGCSPTSYTDKYSLAVTQSASSATLTFTYDSGATCTVSGPLQHYGQLHDIPGASYVCTGTLNYTTTAHVSELKATAQGIEGRLSATLPDGCQESAAFSAVLL